MNVRSASDKLAHASAVEAVRSDRASAQAAARGGAAPSSPAESGDRVELSAQARARADQASAHGPEIESARVALRAGGGLSDARLHDLRERVRTGHYDQPDVVDRVAQSAARNLGGAE